MKVVALRGVCVGIGLHLQPGDEADLDHATVEFLSGINAVKVLQPPPEEVATPPAPDVPAVSIEKTAAPPDVPTTIEPTAKGAKAPKKGS